MSVTTVAFSCRRVTDVAALVLVLVSVLVASEMAHPLLAQSPLPAAKLIDSTVRPGPPNYAGYSAPGFCLAAVRRVEAQATRTRVDSAAYQPEHDTLSTVAIATARACVSHFTLANTARVNLLDLAHLALITSDSAKTQQAADRYVAGIEDPIRRRWALFAVDTMYLNANPTHLAEAEATALRLDSLGAAAALQRNVAHRLLLDYARRRYDVPRIEREAVALVHACLQLTKADRSEGGNCATGEIAFDLLFVELYKDPTTALAHTEQLLKGAGLPAREWDGFVLVLHAMRMDWGMAQIGKPVPPLQALATPQPTHWAGGKGGGGRDSIPRVWPVSGRVSIYLRGTQFDRPETMTMWRRLGEKYGAQLNVTIQVTARGSFHNGPPLTPAEEAARLATFYREQLGIPATVVVAEPSIEQLPPPDGRITRGQAAFEKDPYYQSEFILTDRAGKILLCLFNGVPDDPVLNAWLARAVGPGGR
jgi:hypothetical protein